MCVASKTKPGAVRRACLGHVKRKLTLLHFALSLSVGLIGCDRTPDPRAIQGTWTLSPQAAALLGFDALTLNSRLSLLPNGKLVGENIPGVVVGKATGSRFSASGSWHVATDSTASIVLKF